MVESCANFRQGWKSFTLRVNVDTFSSKVHVICLKLISRYMEMLLILLYQLRYRDTDQVIFIKYTERNKIKLYTYKTYPQTTSPPEEIDECGWSERSMSGTGHLAFHCLCPPCARKAWRHECIYIFLYTKYYNKKLSIKNGFIFYVNVFDYWIKTNCLLFNNQNFYKKYALLAKNVWKWIWYFVPCFCVTLVPIVKKKHNTFTRLKILVRKNITSTI